MPVDLVRYIATAAELIAVARILWAGGLRRFPFLLMFLLTDLAGAAFAIAYPVRTPMYKTIWIYRQPVAMISIILAAIESVARLAEGYPDFKRRRREIVLIVFSFGTAAALVTIGPDIPVQFRRGIFYALFSLRRLEAVAMATAMTTATLLYALFPAPARRNSIISFRILVAFLISDAVGYFAMTVKPTQLVQLIVTAVTVACYAGWSVFMTRKGDSFRPLQVVSDRRKRVLRERAKLAEAQFEESLGNLED